MLVIRHRGPDGEGKFIDHEVGLGHRRLSIIDLAGGAQPIGNEDGSVQIVFNGEVYNFVELRQELEKFGHKFKTHSDTEVIVHAYEQWGTACVKRFNGMFAFAIWDSRRRELFLARDHLGIKPLYYVALGQQLVVCLGDQVAAAASSLSAGGGRGGAGRTIHLSIRALSEDPLQGHQEAAAGSFHGSVAEGIRVESFWHWVPRKRKNYVERDLVEEYQVLLEDAVRLQLRSDVPLGLFLSSGVDSGVLLAIMRKYSSGRVQTFTIGFEGGEKTNEVKDARAMALRFGADHEFQYARTGRLR